MLPSNSDRRLFRPIAVATVVLAACACLFVWSRARAPVSDARADAPVIPPSSAPPAADRRTAAVDPAGTSAEERATVEPASAGDGARAEEPSARAAEYFTLHVLAADSKRELAGVEIRMRTAPGSGAHLLPTESPPPELVLEGGRSPIRLPKEPSADTYVVRAPGFAWESVLIFGGRPEDEYTVELQPACELEVQLHGYRAEFAGYVWLACAERAPDSECRAALEIPPESLLGISDLRPGAYVVRVQRGDWTNPAVLGDAPVDVRPGERNHVDVTVEPPADDRKVPLSGVLVPPADEQPQRVHVVFAPGDPALDGRQERLEIRGLRELEPISAGEYRFDLGTALPGKYTLYLSPLGGQREFVLGPSGDTNVRLEFPQRYDVLVRIVASEARGERHRIGGRFRAEGEPSHDLVRPTYDAEVDAYRLKLPIGDLIVTDDGDAPSESEPLAIRPGENVFTIELVPLSRVDVRMSRDGKPELVGGMWNSARIVSVADGAWSESYSLVANPECFVLQYAAEGACLLDLRPVGGELADLAPLEVFLTRGQTTRVDVALPSKQ